MTKRAKKLEQMRNNPRDWRIEDLVVVAREFGIHVEQGKGSHVYFTKKGHPAAVSVPAHRPIKPQYVRAFVQLIEEISNE